MPGTTLAREATKGSVAVYNAERIRPRPTPSASASAPRPHRNLQASMWGVLFAS